MIHAVIKQHARNKNQYSVKAVLDAALSSSSPVISMTKIDVKS